VIFKMAAVVDWTVLTCTQILALDDIINCNQQNLALKNFELEKKIQ
jgi:hypothetical protein